MVNSTPKRIRDRNEKFQLRARLPLRLHGRVTYSCQRRENLLSSTVFLPMSWRLSKPSTLVTPNLDSGLGEKRKVRAIFAQPIERSSTLFS